MRSLHRRTLIIIALFSTIYGYASSSQTWSLRSPNNRTRIVVTLQNANQQNQVLRYKVDRISQNREFQVVESSPLGLIRNDQQFSSNLKFISKSFATIRQNYTLKIGRKKENKSYANEMKLNFASELGAKMCLEIRAYDNGVAFRYVFPDSSSTQYIIRKELTGFKLPASGRAWIQSYDKPTQYSPGYERFYETNIPVGSTSPLKEGWAFPALFNASNSWILISEANLKPSYCGVHLESEAEGGLYTIRFPEKDEAQGIGEVEPRISLPWVSPWRFITIASTVNQLFESNLVYDLSDNPDNKNYSWVKPGRSSWSWLSENDSPKNFNTLKEFVDFSAKMKWEYSLVDANWDLMVGGDIEELAKYAKEKGVGLLMWYNSGGPNNSVTERPRDIIFDKQRRRSEFRKLEQWGVKGVKIDFWGSDKQDLIKLYEDVLKDAAEFHILVNLHGCTLPRGWSKTYPNLISHEAVKGEENYLFDPQYPENAPIQNSVFAFTRNVVGPMDYTPVVFSNFKYPHLTSNAHELALSLVFNSGIIHFADSQKVYTRQPEFVRKFLSAVPAVFDESHCLWGEPGRGIVVASRSGKDWFVGGINSLNKTVCVDLNLSFLGNKSYKCEIIEDSEDSQKLNLRTIAAHSKKREKISMRERGGFVIRFIHQ